MITNKEVFNALKTLQVFCGDNENCENCPFEREDAGCIFHDMVEEGHYVGETYAPCFWDVERYCRPLLNN